MPVENLKGRTFGQLLVLDQHVVVSGSTRWFCQCSCGAQKLVAAANLKKGGTVSCGCRRNARISVLNRTHGATVAGHRDPEHIIWAGMVQRCTNKKNPRYAAYGGRGIVVCERWCHYPNFLEDMGRRPGSAYSLERKNNDAGYTPDNCIWATSKEQQSNRRNNRKLYYRGEQLTLTEWARRRGMGRTTLRQRLDSGWSVARALETAVVKGNVH